MLILTRRIGETIMIDDDVSITVLDINGKQVRIGIDAPAEVKVHRKEIYLRIQQEQQEQNGQVPFHYQEPVSQSPMHQESGNQRPIGDFSHQPQQQPFHTPVISVRQRSRFSVPNMG